MEKNMENKMETGILGAIVFLVMGSYWDNGKMETPIFHNRVCIGVILGLH